MNKKIGVRFFCVMYLVGMGLMAAMIAYLPHRKVAENHWDGNDEAKVKKLLKEEWQIPANPYEGDMQVKAISRKWGGDFEMLAYYVGKTKVLHIYSDRIAPDGCIEFKVTPGIEKVCLDSDK